MIEAADGFRWARLLVVAAFLIPEWVTRKRFWARVASEHPEIHAGITEPLVYFDRSARRRAFLQGRAYLDLGDPELEALARRMRLLSRGGLVGALLFAIGLALSVRRDWHILVST